MTLSRIILRTLARTGIQNDGQAELAGQVKTTGKRSLPAIKTTGKQSLPATKR
jgi:hypothetical protein